MDEWHGKTEMIHNTFYLSASYNFCKTLLETVPERIMNNIVHVPEETLHKCSSTETHNPTNSIQTVEDQVTTEPTTHSLFDGVVHQVTALNCIQVTHHPQWYRTHRLFIWNDPQWYWMHWFIWKQSMVILSTQTHLKQSTVTLNTLILHLKTTHSSTESTDSSPENHPQ